MGIMLIYLVDLNSFSESFPFYQGMICGLNLERSEENLALTFLAVMQALAYGTKHIVQELQKYGSYQIFQYY